MMTSKSDKSIQKANITRMAFNQSSLEMEFSWSYEWQVHVAFAVMMNKVLKKVYAEDEEGYGDALTRHVEFFSITPQLAPLAGGIVASMKEMESRDEVDGEAIFSIRTVLMEPLNGIDGSVFIDYLQVIAVGVGILLAQNRNIFGSIVYFLMYNIPAFIIHYFGAHFGYSIGLKYLQRMQASGMVNELLAAASVLDVMVISRMSKDTVWTTLNVELSEVGEEVTTLQSILDGIMPGLIGLGGIWMCLQLLKKRVNPIMLILGTMALGIVGAYLGMFAG